MACASSSGPREALIGRWKSDRETTLAGLEKHPTITEKQRELLEEMLGDLVVEYTRDEFTAYLEDWSAGGPYDVHGDGPNFVDIRAPDLVLGESTVRRVWVEGDRMWIWVEGIGFHEYFVRLP